MGEISPGLTGRIVPDYGEIAQMQMIMVREH